MASPEQAVSELCTWGAENLRVFWVPVLASILGGAVGGVAECLTHIKHADGGLAYDKDQLKPGILRSLVAFSAVIGIAGAWGTLFIFVATRWWDTGEAQSESLALFVLTLSAGAGFGARRLLQRLTARLEEKIDQAVLKSEEAADTAKQAKDESGEATRTAQDAKQRALSAEEIALQTEKISRALQVANEASPAVTQVYTCIEELHGILRANSKNRSATIVLGRLLAIVNDTVGALDALSQFIEIKIEANELDGDLADVYFNRACYHSMKWQELLQNNPAVAEEHRVLALKDLRRAFELKPRNVQDAKGDPDLEHLRAHPDGKALIDEFTKF